MTEADLNDTRLLLAAMGYALCITREPPGDGLPLYEVLDRNGHPIARTVYVDYWADHPRPDGLTLFQILLENMK